MLCHHPDELHRRPESAGRCTDTGQSPSAAPAGESHTQETSLGGRKPKKEPFRWTDRDSLNP